MLHAPPYTVLPYGDNAWLVQLTCPDDFPLLLSLKSTSVSFIRESIIGYDSLLILTQRNTSLTDVKNHIDESLKNSHSRVLKTRHHSIETRYDGADIAELSTLKGVSTDAIIQLHTSALYTVRFLGFSPGFAYLDGLPKELHTPRRPTPRVRMETGAIAIGGAHTGIYTIPSPGGWNWIGHTSHPLFNKELNSSKAFTLRPGDTLQFIAI